jgi:hypothetical protein
MRDSGRKSLALMGPSCSVSALCLFVWPEAPPPVFGKPRKMSLTTAQILWYHNKPRRISSGPTVQQFQ